MRKYPTRGESDDLLYSDTAPDEDEELLYSQPDTAPAEEGEDLLYSESAPDEPEDLLYSDTAE